MKKQTSILIETGPKIHEARRKDGVHGTNDEFRKNFVGGTLKSLL